VVYVIDSRGEFGRALPYATLSPRPVVGSAGLAGRAWHWAWERHGAPQLNSRFEKRAGRRMGDLDWAAWMAVKAVVEAAIRGAGTHVAELRQVLVSNALVLDGFKGNRLNFRAWNRQLRQPMLLASDNWVVDRAPMAGFLHPDNTMDTLGLDPRESGCPA
jgi:ABC transporter substrate binding protein (PQQ-dependent alcohol dehydrogenase system)